MPNFTVCCEPRSSTIRQLRYDPDSQVLRATFISKDQYDYDPVPPEVAGAVMFDTKSVGGAFDRLIKKANIPYTKVTKPKLEADLDGDIMQPGGRS